MEIVDATGHRALAYVAAVLRQGYPLSVDEFEQYVSNPEPTVTGPLARAISQAVRASALGQLARSESVLNWLVRIGWLERDAGRVYITPLGAAVLRHAEEAEKQIEETTTEIILSPNDELSYARVIGLLAAAGRAALVDPYFSIESLLHVIQQTEVDRILVKPDPQRTAALATALDTVRIERPFEIRASDTFHDRLVIPESGPVRFIGTSLSGVGKRLAVTAQISADTASDALRAAFHDAWAHATLVASTARSEPVETPAAEATADNGQDAGAPVLGDQ